MTTNKLLEDAKASGFEIIGSQIVSDTFHTNITEKLTKFPALVLEARGAVNESCGWFIEDKDGFIEQVFPHIHPPQEGAFKLYTTPQSSDAEEKLKIAREALKAIILGQTTRDHELMLSTVGMAAIAKQALEKIGE